MKLLKYILFIFCFLFSFNLVFAESSKDSLVNDSLVFNFFKQNQILLDSTINSVLYKTIYDWKDVNYRYAGNSEKGIDCSHFTAVLYRNVYRKELSGSSADYCKGIDSTFKNKADLKIGDMVFFKIQHKRVSHVGVYIGNNKIAHSTVQSGVIISDLNEPYYKKYFFACGRYKNLN